MTLAEIYNAGHIRVRTYNVCQKNGLLDLIAIFNYYGDKKTFIHLKGCGKLSNNELIRLCRKNTGIIEINDSTKSSASDFHELIAGFSRRHRELVDAYIVIEIKNLSNRSEKSLVNFLDGNVRFFNIYEKILAGSHFEFRNVPGIGVKCQAELNAFKTNLIDLIYKVGELKEDVDLETEANRLLIKYNFPKKDIPDHISRCNSVFQITDHLIQQNAIFESKNKNIVFKEGHKIYSGHSVKSISELSIELNLTKERTRQIRQSVADRIFTKLLFLKSIKDDFKPFSEISNEDKVIFIDDDITEKINNQNKTNFTNAFVAFLIYVRLSDRFLLLGSFDDVLFNRSFEKRERHNWKNFYLVDREISQNFQFNQLINDIETRLKERIEYSYSLNLKGYLSEFLKNQRFDLIGKISIICELIINTEFELYLDKELNINFIKNTFKQSCDYAREALEFLARPAKLTEILNTIHSSNPTYQTDESKLRATMQRKNGFVSVGRTSVYALKDWEFSLTGFKGGTIRNIAREFLMDKEMPKHITEITKHVLMFRPNSNEKSILHNLKLDKTKLFVFYQGRKVGLSTIKYDLGNIKLMINQSKTARDWETSYNCIVDFLKEYKRLPYSSGSEDSEIKLYRWYRIQLSKYRKGLLDHSKIEKLEGLYGHYKSGRKSKALVPKTISIDITDIM